MSLEAITAAQDVHPTGGRLSEPPDDVAGASPIIELAPYDHAAGTALAEALGIAELAGQVLVRRGIDTPELAREWLTGGAVHAPELLPGAVPAADVIAAHLGLGSRIAVHGDYDVDGVSSTAIMVRALSALDADVTWHVPSRFGDGYGLSIASVDRLADDGAQLIIAVDCGVGSVAEVAHARSRDIDVVICDHHTPGVELPDAPLVHPGLADYPQPALCAAATTHKLAQLVTLRAGGEAATLDDDLALVALATVCDVVPLQGENRALVRAGLERMRRTQNPGLRELMRVAGVDQLKVTASSFGFALGPRINAAGRMHSAEPAVELLLTQNRERAAELADKLGAANERRREIEQEILSDAERQARDQRDRYAIVVHGVDWHPGVLGIVAGRIAEKYRRPAVALVVEGGIASGSGRNGGVYDLHAGLAACADLLLRFGGHRAAAGLALDESALPAFRDALAAHAAAALTPEDLRPRMRVDAIAAPGDITLQSVEALEALEPFGASNPEPQILVTGADLVSVSRLGRSGQHFRLGIAGDQARAQIVAFRQERVIAAPEQPLPAAFVVALQRNEFNGRVEAQAVLRAMLCAQDRDSQWNAIFAAASRAEPYTRRGALDEAAVIDRRGYGAERVVLELLADGAANIAVVANDTERLQSALQALATADDRLAGVVAHAFDDMELADCGAEHFVLAEPPPTPGFSDFGDARVVLAWNDAAADALAARAEDLLLGRSHVVAAFRAVRDVDQPQHAPAALRVALPGPRIAGRALRVLEELGYVEVQRDGGSVEAIVMTDVPRNELDQSFTFRSYSGYREESEPWLRRLSTDSTAR